MYINVYISSLRVSPASEHLNFTSYLYFTFVSPYLLPWTCISMYNKCIQYVYCCSNLQIWFFSNTFAGSSDLYAGYEGSMTRKEFHTKMYNSFMAQMKDARRKMECQDGLERSFTHKKNQCKTLDREEKKRHVNRVEWINKRKHIWTSEELFKHLQNHNKEILE